MPESNRSASEIKGIDLARVSEWLEANVEGARAPFQFKLITGGRSNLTYRVTDAAGWDFVVRRPPMGNILATAHDMTREHRIVGALGDTDVPVPQVLGLCDDEDVNGRPFYVMNYVEGHVLVDKSHAERVLDERARGVLSEQVPDVMAALHNLDPDDVGLGDLGRREDYLARQLKRWQGQWEKTKTRELATMDEVHAALLERMPPQEGSGIVHGDYRLGNMLVGEDGRIRALLDWELCTLGDPLADLGYVLNNWAEYGEEGGPGGGAAVSPTALPGFSTRDALVARYAAASGREIRAVNYYRAFQYWRLAAIVEGVLARYLKGAMGDKIDTNIFKVQVDEMAAAAHEMIADL